MWARWVDLRKYHAFDYVGSGHWAQACRGRYPIVLRWGWIRSARPRIKDRCKRCVAALARRAKDEDA